MPDGIISLIVLLLLAAFVIIVLVRTVRVVPQQTALIIERLGRYSRTLEGGLHILVPFVDLVRANIDLREQVVSFPPQPVITSDNLVVSIDTVIYYQVIDPKSAVYEIANFIQGIEQLTVTTLRNVIGSLDLEQTLTSRDQINGQLRGVLDEATGKWGIRVNRVELKAIDPPHSIQESMEKQMKAERERRAIILTAEGSKASQILTAEGEKQSQILRAEGSAQARILEAQGQARAIQQVFDAIHRGKPDPEAARLPVPPGAAADRPRRLQQDVDHPERAHRRPQGHRRHARPRPAGASTAAARTSGSTRARSADAFEDAHPRGPGRRPSPRPAARPGSPSREAEEHASTGIPRPAPDQARRGCRPAATRDPAGAPAPPPGPPDPPPPAGRRPDDEQEPPRADRAREP